jgi:hypothetical protein
VIDAMAQQKVFIGRIWPVMPTWVRITVGTHDEMQQFQVAFQKVMRGTTAFSLRAGKARQEFAEAPGLVVVMPTLLCTRQKATSMSNLAYLQT